MDEKHTIRDIMNLAQLEYLIEAIKTGSFSSAGRSLFVTPQTISRSIAQLEAELDIKLFSKQGKSIAPTPFGKLFAAQATEILSLINDLKLIAERSHMPSGLSGRIALGIATTPYRGSIMQPTVFDSFKKQYPDIVLDIFHASSGMCVSSLDTDVLDAAIILGRYESPETVCIKVFSLDLAVLVSTNCKLASKKYIHLEDLEKKLIASPDDLRYTYVAIKKEFENRNISLNYTPIMPFLNEQKEFINGGGVMFAINDLSLKSIYPNTEIIPLHESDSITLPICYISKKDTTCPALKELEKNIIGRIRNLSTSKCQPRDL